MIEINGLTKRFDKTVAVDNLTVRLDSGIIGLVGQNGSGKSTLLRLTAGIYQPDGGDVLINGIPARDQKAKADVFFLSDDPLAPKGANIDGTLDFYLGLFDLDQNEFNRIIDVFGLPRNKPVGTFSKGMKRQVFVAIALSMKANHLLLDEAFDGLDPLVIDAIKSEILAAAAKGKTIVISSHNIFALQRLVDRFVVLSRGKLAKEGATEDIGTEFIKFQAAFKTPVVEANFTSLGYQVVSFRNVGSVSHVVLLGNEGVIEEIREKFNPLFIEPVPLDPEEVVSLEMMLAKQEGENHNA